MLIVILEHIENLVFVQIFANKWLKAKSYVTVLNNTLDERHDHMI